MAYNQQNSRLPLVRPMESCPSSRNYAPIMYGSPHNWNVACHQFPLPIPSVQSNIPNRSINSRMISPVSNSQPFWQNNINYDANSPPCWSYQQPYNFSTISSIPVVGTGNTHLDNFSRYNSPLPSVSPIRKTTNTYQPNVTLPTLNKYPDKWKETENWFPVLNDKTKQLESSRIDQHKLDNTIKDKKSLKEINHQNSNKTHDKHENITISKDRNTNERYRSRERRHQNRSIEKYRTRSKSRDRQSGRYKERNRSRERKREHSDHRSHRTRESYRSRSRNKEKGSSKNKECYKVHHSKKHRLESVSSDDDSPEDSCEEEGMQDDSLKPENNAWIRSSPAELYYQKSDKDVRITEGTAKLKALQERFKAELVERSSRVKSTKVNYEPPPRKICLKLPKPPKIDSESSSDEETESEEEDTSLEELERKKKHPDRLHEELWYNDPGEMNDGPVCRCSAKARRSGIRHGIYPGEEHLPPCDPNSNNADRLYHYRITMSPHTNFLTKCPTIIKHDGHEYIFEGFSMFSHSSLKKLPTCKVIRFNIEYTILYLEEKFPDNFTIEGLELFTMFLFYEILELVDLDWKAHGDSNGCPRVHFMPRFARSLEDNGKELLSMNVVLQYLLNSNYPLVKDEKLPSLMDLCQHKWQDYADEVRGMIVTYPGMKPCSLRVDQLDREQCEPEKGIFPEIVHFGIRPPQLSYAGNPSYQKAWRDYVKFRHLLANKPKVVYADRHKLLQKEIKLQEMRMKSNLKRDVTVVVSSKGFYRTGIMCDIIQHAMLLPVLVCHIRFHNSLDILEEKLGTSFIDRYLLQLALTHPSYRENFGTNPDHARNSLTNCGIRQPEYGDRRIHYMNTRKRGINTLINIMSRFGRREETMSSINHNERLEFLGDAVVEFLSSIHLFFMFPDLEEGGLATYRAALVQNQHLAVLAKKLELERFMLYAHGSDLCHDLELRHAMANCFEALMGALFLDSGINVADRVFCETLFSKPELRDVWKNLPPHPLQEQEPEGDRKWIEVVPLLKELHEFEKATGIEFTHIRLLARAFTHRSVGYNNLTLGSNQRLEFLGDTVLQLVASEYLYRHFPEHHEGHLSLLRSSLVNNRTQAVVCDDLGMVDYAIYPYPKGDLKTKDRADLLEAFLGALYVDKDLEYCQVFCQVCFFPRLQDFIMNQDWNDPKSKLQQCCLTLRTMDGGEPDIPVYKVIECKGPTNTRVYTVAVYFRGERLATGFGHSIQQAEMAAASNALDSSKANLFPQLGHQKRVIERSMKQQDHRIKPKENLIL